MATIRTDASAIRRDFVFSLPKIIGIVSFPRTISPSISLMSNMTERRKTVTKTKIPAMRVSMLTGFPITLKGGRITVMRTHAKERKRSFDAGICESFLP